ncbi:hypothetical protein jhhlp_008773 [Lomentospora prolificans]|uniref:Rhodopsin domain-containing protein n=1 Tax=Lomentospora prolificans TaxID=41688 RepID=A0A2N3MYZ2_9PEZI|nr:hypothetical protein jhhlp_008773 [Lomentospora prolificans]
MDSNGIIPIAPPPPGVTSNFVDPEDLSWQLRVAIGVTLPIAFIICLLRLYTSRFIVGRWHIDDGLIALAVLLSVGYAISNSLQAKYALGRHLWDVPYQDGVTGAMIEITAGAVTYNMSLVMTKTSILFFYLRFPSPRLFRAACYAVMAMAIGNGLTAGFSFLYLCQPIRKHWDWAVEGKCVASFTIPFWVAAIVNMVTDIFILLLPVWLLRPLRLPPVKMLSVLGVLMAGGFVCGITIYRVIDIPKSLTTVDVTWDYVDNYMWMIIEINVAIICACLPCLKAFVKCYFPNFILSARTQQTVNQALSFLNTTPQPPVLPVGERNEPWNGSRGGSFVDVELADHSSDKTGKWTGSTRPTTGDDISEVPASSSSQAPECKEDRSAATNVDSTNVR